MERDYVDLEMISKEIVEEEWFNFMSCGFLLVCCQKRGCV